MRLWHKDLIPYLPNQQLLGQWKEIFMVKGCLEKKGATNHFIVSYCDDANPLDIVSYGLLVKKEMNERGFNTDNKKWIKFIEYFMPDVLISEPLVFLAQRNIFKREHNEEYLRICYRNLREKFIRGRIDQDDWDRFQSGYTYLVKYA